MRLWHRRGESSLPRMTGVELRGRRLGHGECRYFAELLLQYPFPVDDAVPESCRRFVTRMVQRPTFIRPSRSGRSLMHWTWVSDVISSMMTCCGVES
ncbi:hypothetical protein FIBSPDRAFT_115277 [Athelia psychrophila]|uniref:Uncharacterized protein n=1 Tax=Athelia psychrophila TaxID=1759441 RepID=A0A166D394_9AGAM|nr:hypothetical protein FIBSPDRAFT_115277 [Fibularhizoctonia sp. CBS 109695]